MRFLFYVENKMWPQGGDRGSRTVHVPGRNPGTSTKVMMGILNASQKRTNRAPLTEALMSKQPVVQNRMF